MTIKVSQTCRHWTREAVPEESKSTIKVLPRLIDCWRKFIVELNIIFHLIENSLPINIVAWPKFIIFQKFILKTNQLSVANAIAARTIPTRAKIVEIDKIIGEDISAAVGVAPNWNQRYFS